MSMILSPERNFELPSYAAEAAEIVANALSPSTASSSSSFDCCAQGFLDIEAAEEVIVLLSSPDSSCNSFA